MLGDWVLEAACAESAAGFYRGASMCYKLLAIPVCKTHTHLPTAYLSNTLQQPACQHVSSSGSRGLRDTADLPHQLLAW
jgi:hypothetical protein